MQSLLAFLLLLSAAAAAQNLTAMLPANVSALEGSEPATIEVISLNYPAQGVVEDKSFEAFGTASRRLTGASCSGPSPCSCKQSAADFSCSFSPPVAGAYALQLSSENLGSTYYLELREGKQVKLTSVLEAEPPSSRWPFYALAGLGLVFVSYLAYLLYQRLTRRRRNARKLAQRKREVEHDMETLRFRYMKREIDEITLAQLMQQKKLELIQLNAQLEEAGKGASP